MKTNWSLIAGSAFFVVAVFAAAVLDGFKSVDAAPVYATAAASSP